MNDKKSIQTSVFIILILLALVIFYYAYNKINMVLITNFEECVQAGNSVMESYPRQCKDKDGNTFVEEIQSCVNSRGDSMTLDEAKVIASKSECGDKFKESSMCNEETGTYWIDLDIEREGCNPACVVNLETKTAEINWRCTGLIE